MSRTRPKLVDGVIQHVPLTPEEEAQRDADEVAEAARLSSLGDGTAERNGAALDERQKKTAKDEAAALAKSGDYKAAILKILEFP